MPYATSLLASFAQENFNDRYFQIDLGRLEGSRGIDLFLGFLNRCNIEYRTTPIRYRLFIRGSETTREICLRAIRGIEEYILRDARNTYRRLPRLSPLSSASPLSSLLTDSIEGL